MGRRLTYIKSTGTQYIDTGFKPNQNTKIVIDFQLHEGGDWYTIFGARQATGVNQQQYALWVTDAGVFSFFVNAGSGSFGSSHSVTDRHTFTADAGTIALDGESVSVSFGTFQSAVNMALFACNAGGTLEYHSEASIFSCQIYDGETLIRDYVPWENDDGKIGMLDQVNNVFYGDAAGGSFVAGGYVATILQHIFEGLTNDVEHFVRVFPINPKGYAQSELGGQVASDVPSAFPEEPTAYNLLETVTVSRAWTAPASGYYKIKVFGATGSGGRPVAGYWASLENNHYYADGAGGGSNAYAESDVMLKKGDTLENVIGVPGNTSATTVTINSTVELYSVMNVVSGGNGGNGSYSSANDTFTVKAGVAGTAGTASGGNVTNINGNPGRTGSASKTCNKSGASNRGAIAGGAATFTGGTAGGKSGTTGSSTSYSIPTYAGETGINGKIEIYAGDTNKIA